METWTENPCSDTIDDVHLDDPNTSAVLLGQVLWDGKPVIDDDDGGTAFDRVPRRPRPSPLSPQVAALEEPRELVSAGV